MTKETVHRRQGVMIALLALIICAFAREIPGAAQTQNRNAQNAQGTFQSFRSPVHTLQTKLRMSWGGPKPLRWQGSISIDSGKINGVNALGLTADTPGTIQVVDRRVQIHQLSPVVYSGMDVEFEGHADSIVSIELAPIGQPELKYTTRLKLGSMFSNDHALDLGHQNRMTITRSPGDQIQFECQRDHLVFEIGEPFALSLKPNDASLSGGTVKCSVQIVQARTSAMALWSDTFEIDVDSDGNSKSVPLSIAAPTTEGVYDLIVEMTPVQSVLQSVSFFSKKSKTISRRIQFVALSRNPPHTDTHQQWQTVAEIEPYTDSKSSINMFSLAALSRETAADNIKSQNVERVLVENQQAVQLPVGGWQALKLPIQKSPAPYRVEIEYVNKHPAAIGFSLLQSDSAGQVSLYGFDSGVVVPNSIVTAQYSELDSGTGRTPNSSGTFEKHQITIWPSSNDPYLLIANRHESNPAVIGKIRVLSGPNRLGAPNTRTNVEHSDLPNRKMMAFYESPLFAEHFGSEKTLDTELGQPIDDWVTFYRGADRLIQHLKSNGYQGAFVAVMADGSCLYPSQSLLPTPKYDSGIFASNGQDPMRKDVVEMLFRMFEREGLSLVPTLSFSSTLPAVERIRPTDGMPADFELVDFRASQPSTQNHAKLPYYNPLDLGVQKAITDIVNEFSKRYGGFDSFDGLSIICRPDTPMCLPGRRWCYDPSTTRRFIESLSNESQPDGRSPRETLGANPEMSDLQQFLLVQNDHHWMNWRRQQMANWHQNISRVVKRHASNAVTYFAPVDLFRSPEIESLMTPSLHHAPDLTDVMRRLGFDPKVFHDDDSMVLLKPHRVAPNHSLAKKRTEYGVEQTGQLDDWFNHSGSGGDLFVHRTTWAHFQQLEQHAPFANQQMSLMRLQPFSLSNSWNRQRFAESFRQSDPRVFVDGGGLLPIGEQQAIAEFNRVFSSIPSIPFDSVPSLRQSEKQHPVVIRQARHGGKLYFYAVNTSPWPVDVSIAVSGNAVTELQQFGNQPMGQKRTPSGNSIVVSLKPFSLDAGVAVGQSSKLENFEYQLPQSAEQELKRYYFKLRAKLVKSSQATSIPMIANPSFEGEIERAPDGWAVNSPTMFQVLSTEAAQGPTALELRCSQGNAWIRSSEFTAPKTGRLSISVWLKTTPNGQQPPLRICVEGTSANETYYRFGSVGSLVPDRQLNQLDDSWKRFAVHFDDLPLNDSGRNGTLRIGFDMMGPGAVLIDNVEVFDRWFDENDVKTVTQLLASAGPLLSSPDTLEHCRRLMSGYWPKFLDQNFSEQNPSRTARDPSEALDSNSTQGVRQRFRRLVSPKLFQFR